MPTRRRLRASRKQKCPQNSNASSTLICDAFRVRVLTSGFAFREVEGSTGYEGLLTGKSAHLVTTMDTPRWIYRWIYKSPGHHAMKHATLQFCGIWPVRISAFGPVRGSSHAERKEWLNAVRNEDAPAHAGMDPERLIARLQCCG